MLTMKLPQTALTFYDVEQGILAGKIRRTWPKEGK